MAHLDCAMEKRNMDDINMLELRVRLVGGVEKWRMKNCGRMKNI